MRFLIDSDYVAEYLKGREQATSLLNKLNPQGLSISIINFAEIYEGIYYGYNRKKHERGWRAFLHTTAVLTITKQIAKQYAVLRGELAKQGKIIDQPDLFIAATAIYHDLTLVTRNIKDYQRIPQLKIYQS